jgi:hypothetical protein
LLCSLPMPVNLDAWLVSGVSVHYNVCDGITDSFAALYRLVF